MHPYRPHSSQTILKLFAACLLLACLLPVRPVAAAVSIVDDAGTTVRLAAPARRIVPLYAGLGETLVAMGLEDRVVGRTASDDSLPAALPVVGTHMRPNPEILAGLTPDLIVQFEGREEAGLAAESLIRLGLNVARFRIASFADLFSCVERLGILTGEEEAASRLVAGMRARLEAVREGLDALPGKPAVFFEVRYPNLLGAGNGSMVNDIIVYSGGENCLADQEERMVRLSEESLILKNPDIYLVQQGPMNKNPEALEERPHFRDLAAVRRGFVRYVPEALYSRPGPHSVEAVEDLAHFIAAWHRNAFAPETPQAR